MGRAYFQEEDYETALQYARMAKDTDGYSDAYWEIRNQWLKKYVTWLIVGAAGLFVLWRGIRWLDRKKHLFDGIRKALKPKKERGLRSNLRYSLFYMRHPIDGSYGISREGRAGWLAPGVLLFLFIVEFLVNKYLCGFLFKTVQDGRYEIFQDVAIILAGMFSLSLCNYLVCTINDGEGKPKQIFTYFCYSLTPYLILTPVCFLLSHVLTNNERFLVTMLQLLTYGWMAVLLVLGIREVNNYTAKETVKVILLTLFTVVILALIVFIIYVLWAQVFEFGSALFGEAVYRIG